MRRRGGVRILDRWLSGNVSVYSNPNRDVYHILEAVYVLLCLRRFAMFCFGGPTDR